MNVRLSDLYSANFRANHPVAMKLAASMPIPHPINNVRYADGISRCRHAKRHTQFRLCSQEVRLSDG
jgi:hypothetical protein